MIPFLLAILLRSDLGCTSWDPQRIVCINEESPHTCSTFDSVKPSNVHCSRRGDWLCEPYDRSVIRSVRVSCPLVDPGNFTGCELVDMCSLECLYLNDPHSTLWLSLFILSLVVVYWIATIGRKHRWWE